MSQKKTKSTPLFADYEKYRDSLKTGDIVLFGGTGLIPSIIKMATRSEWSHVGMVVAIHEWNLVLLLESNTHQEIKDIDLGETLVGVQLVPLSEKLRQYEGAAAIRSLNRPLESDMEKRLIEFRKKSARKVRYERKWLELISSAVDGSIERLFGENKKDLGSYFCSELVAEAYQVMGLLDRNKASNEFTPGDFSEKWLSGLGSDYSLGPELRLGIGAEKPGRRKAA